MDLCVFFTMHRMLLLTFFITVIDSIVISPNFDLLSLIGSPLHDVIMSAMASQITGITRKMFPFDDVIMTTISFTYSADVSANDMIYMIRLLNNTYWPDSTIMSEKLHGSDCATFKQTDILSDFHVTTRVSDILSVAYFHRRLLLLHGIVFIWSY